MGLKMSNNLEERIFDKVRARTPGAKDLAVQSVQAKFLDGSLYTISWKIDDPQAAPEGYINRAYVHGRDIDIFGNDNELLAIVASTHGNAFFTRLSDPRVVSSIIAILITVVVCGLYVYATLAERPINPPEFLTSGFLLILGFYFGKSVERSRED
jgi:hypothetical protein